jgi:hypothetical protein
MEKREDFTVEQGIDIQDRQLSEWEVILKPEVFEIIKDLVKKRNVNLRTGYDVCRGTDINNIIHNLKFPPVDFDGSLGT